VSWRSLLLALAALLFVAPALAREQINRFDALIELERDGDIIVTETLNVTAEGSAIQRGIFRDLPRYYDENGARLPFDYEVLDVTRDGQSEPHETETDGNAFRIRVGDPDVMLDHGARTYELRYRVANQIRYFERFDELYWNVTGNYWVFPIVQARATIVLPPGARITQTHGYTGALNQSGDDYVYEQSGDRHIFTTTRPLQPEEGLTIAIGLEKGAIDPPSAGDQTALWWQRNGALAILVVSLGGLFWFLYNCFIRVGRDPAKGPIFPRYEAPAGYSPAATHYIYYRAVSGHQALIATLMNLAVKGRIIIDASDKKNTTLTRAPRQLPPDDLTAEDVTLEQSVFGGATSKSLGEDYDSGFTAAYESFQQSLSRKYGSAYFRWNLAYTLGALALTIIVIAIAATQVTQWTIWHTLGVIALAALNAVFMYLMPAPTVKGQQVRTEIEGFRLYMETAEKLQLNAVTPGSGAPPPMTVERYEKFLPYAVALGVEKPWTQHFERLIPEAAAAYHPTWTNMSTSQSFGALTGAMVANMSSGVSSSLPQSSSSSGSGGGGSSGGGGGGGGGGGW
jgi:uncharacterized membrane protein YgcG